MGWAQTEAEAQAGWTEALRADNRVEALRKVIADYPETPVALSGLSFLSRLDPPNRDHYLRQILRDYPESSQALYAKVGLLEVSPKDEPKAWLSKLDTISIEAGGPSLLQVIENPQEPEFAGQVRRLDPETRAGVGYIFVEAQSKLATVMGRPIDSVRLARFNRVTFEQPKALKQLLLDFPDPTPNYNLHPEMEHWWDPPRTPKVLPPSVDRERGLLVLKIETYEQTSVIELATLEILLDGQDVRPDLTMNAEFDLTYHSKVPLEVLIMELPLERFEKGPHHLSIKTNQFAKRWDVEF